MNVSILVLCALAGVGWIYLIANHLRYATRATSIDYDALASYRMRSIDQESGADVDIYPID